MWGKFTMKDKAILMKVDYYYSSAVRQKAEHQTPYLIITGEVIEIQNQQKIWDLGVNTGLLFVAVWV